MRGLQQVRGERWLLHALAAIAVWMHSLLPSRLTVYKGCIQQTESVMGGRL